MSGADDLQTVSQTIEAFTSFWWSLLLSLAVLVVAALVVLVPLSVLMHWLDYRRMMRQRDAGPEGEPCSFACLGGTPR